MCAYSSVLSSAFKTARQKSRLSAFKTVQPLPRAANQSKRALTVQSVPPVATHPPAIEPVTPGTAEQVTNSEEPWAPAMEDANVQPPVPTALTLPTLSSPPLVCPIARETMPPMPFLDDDCCGLADPGSA